MKQEDNFNSDELKKAGENHPSIQSELGCDGFHSRLRELLSRFKSVNAFAVAAGVSPSGLNRLLDGGYPTLPILLSLAKAGGVSVEWLSTGGEIVAKREPPQGDRPSANDVLGNAIDINEFVFIPRYNVRAAAGHGALNETETPSFTMAFRKYWIQNHLNANPQNLFVITVDGSSLEGILNDGDAILVDGGDVDPKEGIYVLRMDGHLLVKLVQRLPGNVLSITSTNSLYAPFSVNLSDYPDDFAIIGKVLWFGRKI